MNSIFTVHRSRLKSLPTSVEVGNWYADFRLCLKSASDMPSSDYLYRLKPAVNADFKSSELGNSVAEFALNFILCILCFKFNIYTVKSAGGLPTSLCLNSATSLPNSTQFLESSY